MAINLLRDGSGKGPVNGRDGLADAKNFSIDETIAHGKGVAGDEDDVNAVSGQDALDRRAGSCRSVGFCGVKIVWTKSADGLYKITS